jgi:hypothetical protein
VSWLTDEEQAILADARKNNELCREVLEEVRLSRRESAEYYAALSKQLNRILGIITPPPDEVAAIQVTETALAGSPAKGEKAMPKTKATADLVILDDGKGVLFTLQPVNAGGAAIPLPAGSGPITGVSSAPASLANPIQDPGDPTATPPRPPDTTGLVFLSTVPQPPVDAVGVVVTFSDTLTSGNTITTAANPIDVTADDSLAGFTSTETAA